MRVALTAGALLAVVLGFVVVTAEPAAALTSPGVPQAAAVAGAAAAPSSVVVRRRSSTSLRLSWTVVPDAVSYRVWRQNTAGTFVKVASVKAAQRSWTDTGLLTGKTQTYQVQACNFVGCGAMSRWVYAVPWKAGDKTVNADRIVVTPPAHPLGQWEQNKDLLAVAAPTAKLSKAGARVPYQTMRYTSSNPSVVTVSAKGILQAGLKLGKATITVIAHDGIQGHIAVSVADYTHPVVFNAGGAGPVQDYWDKEVPDLSDFVSMILEKGLATSTATELSLDDNGNLVSSRPLPKEVTDLAYKIMSSYSLPATISFVNKAITFLVNQENIDYQGSLYLEYRVNTYGNGPGSFPAPHWYQINTFSSPLF